MPRTLYTLPDVQRMLGVSRNAIQHLIAAGFVTPEAANRGIKQFSYRDVVLLRMACALRAAGIPPRRIMRALDELRRRWNHDRDVLAARLSTIEDPVVWRARDARPLAEADQPRNREAKSVARGRRDLPVAPGGQQHDDATRAYRADDDLEYAGDPVHAEAAYRRALDADPTLLDAALNLGYLLCESGRYPDAVSVYEGAIAHGADSPMLQFDLGVALEEAGDLRGALAAYNRCIDKLPDFADAHFNAARIHTALGDLGDADPAP